GEPSLGPRPRRGAPEQGTTLGRRGLAGASRDWPGGPASPIRSEGEKNTTKQQGTRGGSPGLVAHRATGGGGGGRCRPAAMGTRGAGCDAGVGERLRPPNRGGCSGRDWTGCPRCRPGVAPSSGSGQ